MRWRPILQLNVSISKETDKFSQLCREIKQCLMKKLLIIPFFLLLAAACEKSGLGPDPSRQPEGEIYHDMIQLGEKLEDPYTVANMQEALTKVYPTKAGRVEISATDYYVRFLPKDDDQLKALQSQGLYLMDHPMDYSIRREGDYYQDPSVGENAITWQYAVVPTDFAFPQGVKHEILDECFLSDHLPESKAVDGVDWERVEEEAFRLTGNEDLWQPSALTKGGSGRPEGRITIVDPKFNGGTPIGVSGVMVACNIFVKIGTTYTDRDGYYKMGKSFSGSPRYRLVFKNEKGFNIGLNLILIPASVSTLGKGSPEGIDYLVNEDDGALFRRCVVNNAAYDYYTRCTRDDLDILPPPGDLRIWILNGLRCSTATMLHHGAYLEDSVLKDYLGFYLSLVELFLPDITIGSKEKDYSEIYKEAMHELAHASHYAKVGNSFWAPYLKYTVLSLLLEGGQLYGSGGKEDAGYCEIGEMWAFFMQESLYKDHYGGTITAFGNKYWFQPDIFTYLYERGMSRSQIFRCLTSEVTAVDDLKEELIGQYSSQEKVIEQAFRYFGK